SHTKQMKILFNLFDIDHAPEGELTWDLDFEESSGTVGGFAIKAQKPDKEGSDR
ncbi:MAG: hypothetical protein GTN70_03575, partial [Deltaproteobacteria bacterium]|nr:hypothetical protein [Deltaproteobacteria bacterium]NIS76732.1 hypothetical protein [Deltaproteobacteria bacterium]